MHNGGVSGLKYDTAAARKIGVKGCWGEGWGGEEGGVVGKGGGGGSWEGKLTVFLLIRIHDIINGKHIQFNAVNN